MRHLKISISFLLIALLLCGCGHITPREAWPAGRALFLLSADPLAAPSAGETEERVVWVKDTEQERNMKTGEMILWQHNCQINQDGLLIEDYAVSEDNSRDPHIWKYQYDGNGNCTLEVEIQDWNAQGTFRVFDEEGRLLVDGPLCGMEDEEWLSSEEELRNMETTVEDPAQYEMIKSRYDLYMQFHSEMSFMLEGEQITAHIFPQWLYQYEYDNTGKLIRCLRLAINPEADKTILYDYETTANGSTRSCYTYQGGALVAQTRFYYDGEGREIRWEQLDEQGIPFIRRDKTYDSFGNLTELAIVRTATPSERIQYTYDENGNVLTEKKYDFSWREDIPSETHEYTYKALSY